MCCGDDGVVVIVVMFVIFVSGLCLKDEISSFVVLVECVLQ